MKRIGYVISMAALLLSFTAIGVAQQHGTLMSRKKSVRNKRLRQVGATLGCRDYISTGLIRDENALSKPAPDYPEEAITKHISGVVIVQITIGVSGDVVSARAVSGPPLLQEAAVDAAYRARFRITKLSDVPIKVMGELKYDFVL